MDEQTTCLKCDKRSILEEQLKRDKRISGIFLVIVSGYTLILVIRLFYPCGKGVVQGNAGLQSALNNLFIVLGIVNFTYPYVATTRGTKMYGISMSRVMYSQLRWQWYLYLVYAALDILGFLYVGTSRLCGAWHCLAGMLIVLTMILYTAVTYIFKQHNSCFLIDAYLKDWINGKESGDEACLQAGEYLRAYFLSSQTVSVTVAKALFAFLEKRPFLRDGTYPKENLPFVLLCYSGQRDQKTPGEPDVAMDSVFRARAVFDRVFREMSIIQQTTLLKRLLLVLSEEFPNSKKHAGPVLCGLAAWLREGVADRSNPFLWKQNWELLLDRLLRAGIYSQTEIPWEAVPGYREVLRQLVLLIRASVLVDMTAIQFSAREQLFNTFLEEKMCLLFEHFDIPDGDEIDFYPLGQLIVQATHDPDYDPDRSCVSSYAFLSFWEALRRSENAGKI